VHTLADKHLAIIGMADLLYVLASKKKPQTLRISHCACKIRKIRGVGFFQQGSETGSTRGPKYVSPHLFLRDGYDVLLFLELRSQLFFKFLHLDPSRESLDRNAG
jgi:hypothetical protein